MCWSCFSTYNCGYSRVYLPHSRVYLPRVETCPAPALLPHPHLDPPPSLMEGGSKRGGATSRLQLPGDPPSTHPPLATNRWPGGGEGSHNHHQLTTRQQQGAPHSSSSQQQQQWATSSSSGHQQQQRIPRPTAPSPRVPPMLSNSTESVGRPGSVVKSCWSRGGGGSTSLYKSAPQLLAQLGAPGLPT